MPPERLGNQLVKHLVGVGLGDPPHPHRGERSTEHDANGTHQPNADNQRKPGDHGSCFNVALFKPNNDDFVNHPANSKTRRHRCQREDRSPAERNSERSRVKRQHRTDQLPVPAGSRTT